MARGNRRQPIFWDDDDRRFWLNTLSEACKCTGWLALARVLAQFDTNGDGILDDNDDVGFELRVAGYSWRVDCYGVGN